MVTALLLRRARIYTKTNSATSLLPSTTRSVRQLVHKPFQCLSIQLCSTYRVHRVSCFRIDKCCLSGLIRNYFPRHDVLPYAIDLLKMCGYKLVTVAECLDMDPYLSQGEPETVCYRLLALCCLEVSNLVQGSWSCQSRHDGGLKTLVVFLASILEWRLVII